MKTKEIKNDKNESIETSNTTAKEEESGKKTFSILKNVKRSDGKLYTVVKLFS